jgi:hypothetical protein
VNTTGQGQSKTFVNRNKASFVNKRRQGQTHDDSIPFINNVCGNDKKQRKNLFLYIGLEKPEYQGFVQWIYKDIPRKTISE